ncbi:MucR family transcriptional regulator [Salinarimonas rosea]|uniref:MucR family transcriptional regulator n=1 Tax=Salinarimonas rosea TaxID=552063 RepID=UPI000402857D|nr:MucR family transcriptional regulator [Salinarimonas rosea]
MSEDSTTVDYMTLAAEVVASYVANNSLPAQDLPGLIELVYSAVAGLGRAKEAERDAPLEPAVAIRRSVTPDFIVCLEDGKKFKSLKRYLRTRYGLTPEQYRERWGLPPDYPMVAPNYARARSDLAKEMGLGQQRRRRRPPPR